MSFINVSRVLTGGRMAQNVTILRGSGYWSKGEFVELTPTSFAARGSWQRVTSDELRQLDMGDIREEVRKLLSPTKIRVSGDDGAMCDRIVWKDRVYRVLRVDDSSDYGFYRAYATYEKDYEGDIQVIYLDDIPVLDDIPKLDLVPQSRVSYTLDGVPVLNAVPPLDVVPQ